MNAPSPLLEVTGLAVRRGGTLVLDVPGLAVEAGTVLSLIGPNGAGKSTLLLALATLLKAERGALRFKGADVALHNGLIGYRRKIAMVFQEPLLLDTTVYRNVAAGLKIRHLGRSEISSAVRTALERFGIAHLEKRHARKLSGGEAQRTSLARAFALRPEIIFLDEPFSSLDPPTREALLEDLQAILRETKTTAVMATHDRIEALRLSDAIAVMRDGKIVQIAAPDTVVNRPADEFVASFVGMETILPGDVTETRDGVMAVAVDGGTITAAGALPRGERVLCGIRPEQVTLTLAAPEGGTSARNAFTARVTQIVPLGPFYRICLDCGFPLTAYVTIPSLEGLALTKGKCVNASFKATAVHIIRK
jgi:tungstate transport system ATP-binding protein